jgi:L-fuculose-phosphate aldolase
MNNDNIAEAKQLMCDIGRRIWQRGYCAGNEGNHSIRLGEDRVLCTPTGVSKGFLNPEMICLVDMDGQQIDKQSAYRPTSEMRVHLAIYRQRSDVHAVVHSHPPHATAFAIAGMPIPEGIYPEAEIFLGRVPLSPFAMPSKAALADSLLPLIAVDTNTILMGNHGAVCFDAELTEAYYKLEILDNYCRILLLAIPLGGLRRLDAMQMRELLEVKSSFGFPDRRLSEPNTPVIPETPSRSFPI